MTASLLMAGALGVLILQVRGQLKPTPREACLLAWGLTFLVVLTATIAVWGLVNPEFVMRSSLWTIHNALYRWAWIAAFLMTNLSVALVGSARRFQGMVGGTVLMIALITTLLHAAGIRFIDYPLVYSFRGYYRPHGILWTPLEAGLVGLLGWAWGLAWSVQSGWRRIGGLYLVGLSTAVVYLTFSRSAWMGLGGALLVGLLLTRTYKALWLPLIITLATFLMASVALPLGWQRGVYAAQDDPSVQNRLQLWPQFPNHLIRYPFGVTEASADTIEQYVATGSMVNFYLDIGVQYGVLPFVLQLWLVGILLKRVWAFILQGQMAGVWGLGVIASAICVIFMNPSGDSLATALWSGFWGMVSAMEVKPDAPARLHAD